MLPTHSTRTTNSGELLNHYLDFSDTVLSTGVCRRVYEAMYTWDSTESNVFTCCCGTKRKRSGSRYSNLLSHAQSSHPNAYQIFLSGEKVSQAQLDDYFVTSKSRHLYGRMDLIINGLLLYSFVENLLIQKHVKYEPPSLNTFMK